MKHLEIADRLIDLLIIVEKGMIELDVPLPREVETGIKQALVGFGEQILPQLHKAIDELKNEISISHILDILGSIGHSSSIPFLIDLHSNYSGFLSGTAAINALKDIGTEKGYIYLSELLNQRSLGNKKVFNSEVEMVIACKAMGDWEDPRATIALKNATEIFDPNEMPYVALKLLVKKPNGMILLEELAQKNDSLRMTIEKILVDSS